MSWGKYSGYNYNMLVIVSDLHLGDGTTAASIPSSAFEVFARRLSETAYFASWRKDGSYRPIEDLEVILMGDILDPLHSTRWLDTQVRPWSNPYNAAYAPKLLDVTRAILEHNHDSLEILRRCAHGKNIRLAPATRRKKPDFKSDEHIPLKVRFHYMVGNHDWYYHLRGEAFDQIRAEVVKKMGLSNSVLPFPYEADESPVLKDIFARYKVFARHGDYYDKFNYDAEKGRDYSGLGDAFTMDVCNRYPIEVQKRYGDKLPVGVIDSLRRITNIRPALAAPLWVSGQIKAYAGASMEKELKGVWDDIAEEFLQLDFVRQADKAFQFDLVDAMELLIKISGRASFSTINDVIVWVREKMWGGEHSFLAYALQEPAFLNNTAKHIVYGHTHHYEIIPLDAKGNAPYTESQVYFNSGTWHTFYDLAMNNPKEQKFVPYQALTYLTFYADGEHEGRAFDSWSGVYA
jgi:UDP-2,3-diacylglucosamine pyrophosphatase LpxH